MRRQAITSLCLRTIFPRCNGVILLLPPNHAIPLLLHTSIHRCWMFPPPIDHLSFSPFYALSVRHPLYSRIFLFTAVNQNPVRGSNHWIIVIIATCTAVAQWRYAHLSELFFARTVGGQSALPFGLLPTPRGPDSSFESTCYSTLADV